MGESTLSVIILVLKIIVASVFIFTISFYLALFIGSLLNDQSERMNLKHLAAKLSCPSCNNLFGFDAIESAKETSIQNAREVHKGRKQGEIVELDRTWRIICPSCGKATTYDPREKLRVKTKEKWERALRLRMKGTQSKYYQDLMKEFYEDIGYWMMPEFIKRTKAKHSLKIIERGITTRYFQLKAQLDEEYEKEDYGNALLYSQQSLPYLEPLVAINKVLYGAFEITSIPAIERGVEICKEKGLDEELKKIQEVVENIPELDPWKELFD